MAFTYDITKLTDGGVSPIYPPATIGVRYQIRLLLQDNVQATAKLQDEEIDWLQTTEANAFMTAARCCDILIARIGPVSSKHVDNTSISYDPKFLRALANDLRARGMLYQTVYAGGTSISDKQQQEANTDATVPMYFRGFGDNRFADNLAPGDQNSQAINNPNAI